MIDINGKNVLITGSSRGVGQQLAIGFAKLGCNVIVHGRTSNSCKETLKILEKFDMKTYSIFGELSTEDEVNNLIKSADSLGINIDILYNNAAIMTSFRENIWEHTWDDWAKTLNVNVIAMYSLCSHFIPKMIKNGFGRVVNLTSGIKYTPELAPYGASKYGVDKMSEDISSKLNRTGVRINTLDPGWLRTDMGGDNAEHPVEAVLPGGLAPALVEDDGPNGEFFSAINHNLDDAKFQDLLS